METLERWALQPRFGWAVECGCRGMTHGPQVKHIFKAWIYLFIYVFLGWTWHM